ncbi:MAG TPA: CapA family protein, partial [Longimicrobiales bacterium]|nr:CapA family protein [Longimicrobiales bacterium]
MSSSRREFLRLAAAAGMAPPAAALARGHARAAPLGSRLRQQRPDESTVVLAGDLFLTTPFPPRLAPETEEVYGILRGSDAALANLENGLSTTGSEDLGGFRYGGAIRGAPSLVGELSRAGVTAVSLANNHTGNFGPDALLETMATLEGAGIHHAGAGRNIQEAFAPTYFDAGGRRVALLSLYSYYYNFGATDNATTTEPGIAGSRAYDVVIRMAGGFETADRDVEPYVLEPDRGGGGQSIMGPLKEDLDRMVDAVESVDDRAELTIVSVHIHWGRHTKQDLPYQQRVLARAALDAGADLFVGHGPHTLRGIEVYRGRPIFYSLGNFVLRPGRDRSAPPPDIGARSGGHEAVVARIATSAAEIRAVELVPIVIDGAGQPHLARGE